jgi:hypothetical protein
MTIHDGQYSQCRRHAYCWAISLCDRPQVGKIAVKLTRHGDLQRSLEADALCSSRRAFETDRSAQELGELQ